MRLIHRFLALPRKNQFLLLHAFSLLGAIRVALYIFPFRVLLSWALHPPNNRRKTSFSADQIAAAVSIAAPYVPRATCLTQALAAQVLLSRSGYHSTIEVGVANEPPGGFEAHAWVVCEDRIVIGGEQAGTFQRLGSWSVRV